MAWLGLNSHIRAIGKGFIANDKGVRDVTNFVAVRVGGFKGEQNWELTFDKHMMTCTIPVLARAILKEGSEECAVQNEHRGALFGSDEEYQMFANATDLVPPMKKRMSKEGAAPMKRSKKEKAAEAAGANMEAPANDEIDQGGDDMDVDEDME